jgi:sugar-specific transcriptional regulator TrmB
MNNKIFKFFSPQASDIYRLLLKKNSLTAKEIAQELHVFPNTIYRAVKQLQEKGFIKELDTYPISYKAQPGQEAFDLYSLSVKKQFKQVFPALPSVKDLPAIDISFIQTRDDLRENTDKDVSSAKETVDFIVSGLEVPAETILTYKDAIDRGVKIRAIVQRLDDTSEQMFRNWRKIGLQIKFYPNMEARTFIIDKEIVYFTSYDPKNKQVATGMRFNYRPYANIMSELFEQRWQLGKHI